MTTLNPHGLFFVGPDAKENAYGWAKKMSAEFGHNYTVGIVKCTGLVKPMVGGQRLA